MSRIKLNIIGLSSGQSNGSYTLILGEDKGRRKLPIIIGSFEAQAIAIEIEKIVPFRPMTHDLFVAFCKTFNIQIVEVEIYNLIDGVFHAKLMCEVDGESREIDARTSDSIALAVRFKCPIYTYEDIMESAGVVFNDDMDDIISEPEQETVPGKPVNDLATKSKDQLEKLLEDALTDEDYDKAAIIRDELNKRK
ncbi:MAG: bifunctional nuclease family protein [Bacteroidota bacterium]